MGGSMSKMAINADLESSYGILRYKHLETQLFHGNEEVFVPVIGYEDNYVVSNFGTIKRKLMRGKFGEPLKVRLTTQGYAKVDLYEDAKAKTFRTHVVVLNSFYINPDFTKKLLSTVEHKDNDKLNNSLENLMYASMKYQSQMENKAPNPKPCAEKLSRPVNMYDLDGNFVMHHASMSAAEQWLRNNGYPTANNSNISSCVRGTQATAYGYIWKEDEVEEIPGQEWKVVPESVLHSKRDGPYIASKLGGIVKNKHGQVMEGHLNGRMYTCGVLLNRIIAFAWVPNDDPTNNIDVDHVDGDILNHNASNLEWVTRAENVQRAYANGQNSHVQKVRVTDIATGESTIYNMVKDAIKALGVCGKTIKTYMKSQKNLVTGGKKYRVEYI